jgi:hypothetical protein
VRVGGRKRFRRTDLQGPNPQPRGARVSRGHGGGTRGPADWGGGRLTACPWACVTPTLVPLSRHRARLRVVRGLLLFPLAWLLLTTILVGAFPPLLRLLDSLREQASLSVGRLRASRLLAGTRAAGLTRPRRAPGPLHALALHLEPSCTLTAGAAMSSVTHVVVQGHQIRRRGPGQAIEGRDGVSLARAHTTSADGSKTTARPIGQHAQGRGRQDVACKLSRHASRAARCLPAARPSRC